VLKKAFHVMNMTNESLPGGVGAEILALEALGYMARTEDLLGTFLGASGLAAADLPGLAAKPAFLAGVLDFLLMDDAWVTGFASDVGVRPDAVLAARALLPGGDLPHWT